MKYEKWTKEKIELAAATCKTKKEMKNMFPKQYAAAKRMGILNSSIFLHMPQKFKSQPSSKWNKENIIKEASKFSTRKEFFNGSQACYNAAKRMGCFEEACAHMPLNLSIGKKPSTYKWDKKAVIIEASKYSNKKDFKKLSSGAYDAAVKNNWLTEACVHMKIVYRKFTNKQLIDVFKNCKTKKEALKKDPSAYITVKNRKIQNMVFAHMPDRMDMSGIKSPFYKRHNKEIKNIASNYTNRILFLTENPAVYQNAYKRGILDEVCAHMKGWNNGSSMPEKELFSIVKNLYPNSIKLIDRNVKIEDKPYIKGFDIDIYVPDIKRGVEFDGKHYHSFKFMRKDPKRSKWSDQDIYNYHNLKDEWFKSKGIEILHIKEEDWKSNKNFCIQKCIDFLSNNGL